SESTGTMSRLTVHRPRTCGGQSARRTRRSASTTSATASRPTAKGRESLLKRHHGRDEVASGVVTGLDSFGPTARRGLRDLNLPPRDRYSAARADEAAGVPPAGFRL